MKIGKNNNNKGFSLIELMVVIAIIAILIGIATISISILTGRQVKKCADEMVSAMEAARVRTLGKEQNDVECIVYKDADGSLYVKTLQGGNEVSNREIGKAPITITVYFDKESIGYELDNISGSSPTGNTEAGLHILFNRSSGAFVEKANSAGGTVKDYCTSIEVASGSRTVVITPIGKTGKIVRQ